MVQYERDLSGLNLPDIDVLETHELNEKGILALPTEKTCAKTVYNPETNTTKYYVLCYGGQLYNPVKKDIRYDVRNNWKMKSVGWEVYDMYRKFLQHKRETYLRHAERLI